MLQLDKEVFLIYARGNVNGTLIEVLISQSKIIFTSVNKPTQLPQVSLRKALFLCLFCRWHTCQTHSQVMERR